MKATHALALDRTHKASTAVAPQALYPSRWLPVSGVTSSCPKAFALYASHACKKARLTQSRRFCVSALRSPLCGKCLACTGRVRCGIFIPPFGGCQSLA